MLVSYAYSTTIHIYDINRPNYEFETVQLSDEIFNAAWLPNENIIYSTDDGCKVISQSGRLIFETKQAGIVRLCSNELVTCTFEKGVLQSVDNGFTWKYLFVAKDDEWTFWQIVKVDTNDIFWSVELKTDKRSFRLRLFQISEEQHELFWHDINYSSMGNDILPCSLAYDNEASVFVLDAKHGNVHSFSKYGMYDRLILSAEFAGLIKPIQIEFDHDNHQLYILQVNGDIKVTSINYN